MAYYFQKSSKLVTLYVTISYGKKAFCSMDPGQSSFLTIPGGIEEEEEAKQGKVRQCGNTIFR